MLVTSWGLRACSVFCAGGRPVCRQGDSQAASLWFSTWARLRPKCEPPRRDRVPRNRVDLAAPCQQYHNAECSQLLFAFIFAFIQVRQAWCFQTRLLMFILA